MKREVTMDPQLVLTGAQDALTARRVFGDPIQADGVTLVPAAIVSGGGGGGARGAADGGVGFGLKARPAGMFVVRNGDVSWRPAVDVNRVVLGGQLVAITALLVLRPVLVKWLGRLADERLTQTPRSSR
jgi:uncharacterized spore protein YtfJ